MYNLRSKSKTRTGVEGDKTAPQFAKGRDYLVKKRRGDWSSAEVLEIRKNGEKCEYFIHYEGTDRRMDEWVQEDRIIKKPELNLGQSSHAQESGEVRAGNQTDEDEIKEKHVEKVQFGACEMDAWYASPYPKEYGKAKKLFICDFCLKYCLEVECSKEHEISCSPKHPPGKEIYRKDVISVWEIDGSEHEVFCQCLCLLAKMFLDLKCVFFHVSPFLFYVMCVNDNEGEHIAGYFSKEKFPENKTNVSCLLVLPQYQRKGYGTFLISLSYELSRIERIIGTPEKPLSDLGQLAYFSYWSFALLSLIRNVHGSLTIKHLSRMTYITPADIVSTLMNLSLLHYCSEGRIYVSRLVVDEIMKKKGIRAPLLTADSQYLKWTPPHYKSS